jgi:hypothetical protein
MRTFIVRAENTILRTNLKFTKWTELEYSVQRSTFSRPGSSCRRAMLPSIATAKHLKITQHTSTRGCQMVYFQTKNPDLGKF